MPPPRYIGRFAPSPTGPLHFGSLVCAVASFLHAKAHNGHWLLRIEDLDPPREQPDADTLICQTLLAHGLRWDGEVSYQSQHHHRYEQRLAQLQQEKRLFRCNCTRKRIAALDGQYDGLCVRQPPPADQACALRVKLSGMTTFTLTDLISPEQTIDVRDAFGDFIVRRKDGLFAYHLAVVTDDIHQGITHIIRGDDLRESTAPQLHLYNCFEQAPPLYGHIPVVKDERGFKLSKQHGATAVDDDKAITNLSEALSYLGIQTACTEKTCADLLSHAAAFCRANPNFLKQHFQRA